MKFKHQLPNYITISRIVLSIVLLILPISGISFLMVYFLCGLSDAIDGYLARRWKICSEMGAKLDSIADFVFLSVVFIKYLPSIVWERWMLISIILIAFIRLLSIMIGYYKFHEAAFLHTYANKAAGFAIYCFPILIYLLKSDAIFLCILLAGLSAIEELGIISWTKKLDRNCRGFWDMTKIMKIIYEKEKVMKKSDMIQEESQLIIESPSFVHQGWIPKKHTGFDLDISPEFVLHHLSKEAVSIAIIMDDLDIPFISEYCHWVIWNIPRLERIPENIPYGPQVTSLQNAVQGVAYGVHRYRGPKQPVFIRSTHRYRFTFYALNSYLELEQGAKKSDVIQAMQGHILQTGSITGIYKR